MARQVTQPKCLREELPPRTATGQSPRTLCYCRVLPLPPTKLQSVAEEQGFAVVVFPKGQLPLRPGMSEQELGAVFTAYASSQ